MNALAASAVAIAVMMVAVWVASVVKRDASIVDAFWGLGFTLVGWVSFALGPRSPPALVTAILVTVWGLRLAVHIGARNHGQPEDFRYQSMRERIGPRFWIVSLFSVFLLQGLLMWIVALPVETLASATDASIGLGHVAGIAIFAIGLAFESIGDAQLSAWKRDPRNRGKVLDRGLWRYSRHPNYFGDFCVWWGLFVLAASSGAPLWTAVGPLVMSVLLRRVSGVTLLEETMRSRPGYEAYIRRTSPFFPLPPRRS